MEEEVKPPSDNDQLPGPIHDHHQLPIHDLSIFIDSPHHVTQSAEPRRFPNETLYPESFAFLNRSSKLSEADHSDSRSRSRWPSPTIDTVDSSSPSDIGLPCLVYLARGFCNRGSDCQFLHGPAGETSGSSSTSSRPRETSGKSPSDMEISTPRKPCYYFARGFCKLGSECRHLHGDEEIAWISGSLETLQLELQELLMGRSVPISIASLPQLYYKHFGKSLKAEGYQSEERRKRKYTLTNLLARCKSTVTLLTRSHSCHTFVE